jgi:hypothetical protein
MPSQSLLSVPYARARMRLLVGVERQPSPVLESEIELVEPALRYFGNPHPDRATSFDVVDFQEVVS